MIVARLAWHLKRPLKIQKQEYLLIVSTKQSSKYIIMILNILLNHYTIKQDKKTM